MFRSGYFKILVNILVIVGLILVLSNKIYNDIDTSYVEMLFDDSVVHTIDLRPTEDVWKDLMENPDKKSYLPCDIVVDGELYKGVGLRAKGGTTLRQVKFKGDSERYSLKIKFDKYNRSYTYHGLDELVLNNTLADKTYLKEYFSYDMMRKMGVASPYTSFMKITVNGEYYGLFIGIEGMDKSFLKRNYGDDFGELYKPKDVNKHVENPDYKAYGTDLVYTTNNLDDYKGIFVASKTEPNEQDKRRLINSLKILDSYDNIEDCVNIENTLRYFVVHNYINNYDGYTSDILNNYQLYEKNGKLSMLPWDYNLGFGGFKGIKDEYYKGDMSKSIAHRIVNLDIDEPLILMDPETRGERGYSKRPMWTNVIDYKDNRDRYHTIFKEFIDGYIKSGYFENKYNSMIELLDEYIKNDSTSFYSYDEYRKGIVAFKKYCLLRAESIDNQLNGIEQEVGVGDLNLDDMGVPLIVDTNAYHKWMMEK